MDIKVRKAKPKDFERLEGILSQNNMLTCPEIDGRTAMREVRRRVGRYFLIAEVDREVVGLIRGCYNGSRALIHQMAVDKKYQRQGVGKMLMHELAIRFRIDGAPTVSVTSGESSKNYYRGLSFSYLPITLMVASDINEVIERTK